MIRRGAAGETTQTELEVSIGGKRQTHVTSIKAACRGRWQAIYMVGEARDVSELRGAPGAASPSQKMERSAS
jgi:hypothetical protein